MKKLTEKQYERQKYRDSKGRYSEIHRCEECNEKVGLDYWSLENCNKTGKGLILCKKCYDKLKDD